MGIFVPFSSDYSWTGNNVLTGVEAVQQEVKEVTGKTFEILVKDTKGSPLGGLSAARNLVNEGADVLVGPTSLSIGGVIDYLVDDARVTTISPTAGTRQLDNIGGKYIFRTVASDSLGAYAIAFAHLKEFNNKKTYRDTGLIYADTPAMESFVKPLEKAVRDLDLNLVIKEKISSDNTSYRNSIEKIMEKDPDSLVMVLSNEDGIKLTKQARSMGFQGPFVFTQEQANKDFINALGEGVLEPSYTIMEGATEYSFSKNKELSTQANELLKGEVKIFTLPSYDAAMIFALAYEAAEQKTPAGIADKVKTVANPPGTAVYSFAEGYEALNKGSDINYEGLESSCDFNEYGDTVTAYDILELRNGKWSVISYVSSEKINEISN